MTINYNKINFIGGIIGGIVGLVAAISVPLTIRYWPQNLVYLVMGLLAFMILFLFGQMVILFLTPDTVRKMVAFVLILPIIMVAFTSLIFYQKMAPADAPYIDWVNNFNPFNYFQYFGLAFPLLMLIFVLPLLIWLFRFMYSTFWQRENILKKGIGAEGKIISVLDLGMSVNGQPVYKITLEVNSSNYGIYQVTKYFFVPHIDLSLLQPGQVVKVKIDPNKPKNVVFDTWTGEIK